MKDFDTLLLKHAVEAFNEVIGHTVQAIFCSLNVDDPIFVNHLIDNVIVNKFFFHVSSFLLLWVIGV
jgi:hypothetical protein